jgi:hypothetical protein
MDAISRNRESPCGAYVALLNEDPDVTYEHKAAWNEVCDARR